MSGKKPMNLENAEKVFSEVIEILNRFQIKLFLSDGTMLGAIRHKSIIPWDFDIDSRIDIANWDFSIFDEFERSGYKCRKSIDPRYRSLPSGVNFVKHGIDFGIGFNYYYPPDDIVVFLAGRPRDHGTLQPARFYREEHFIKFLNAKVRIPYPPEEYLESVFGANWRIPDREQNYLTLRKPISIEKYVKYFLEHPEINKKK